MVVSCDYSVLLAGLNACPPYFKVESKLTHDFVAQCLLITYSIVTGYVMLSAQAWIEHSNL